MLCHNFWICSFLKTHSRTRDNKVIVVDSLPDFCCCSAYQHYEKNKGLHSMSLDIRVIPSGDVTSGKSTDVSDIADGFIDPSIQGYRVKNSAQITESVNTMAMAMYNRQRLNGSGSDYSKTVDMSGVPLQRAYGVVSPIHERHQSQTTRVRFLGNTCSLDVGTFMFKLKAPPGKNNISLFDHDNLDWSAIGDSRGSQIAPKRRFSDSRGDIVYALSIPQVNWFFAKYDIAKIYEFTPLPKRDPRDPDQFSPEDIKKVIVPLGPVEGVQLMIASAYQAYEHQLMRDQCAPDEWNPTFYAEINYGRRNVERVKSFWPDAVSGDLTYLRFYTRELKRGTQYKYCIGPNDSNPVSVVGNDEHRIQVEAFSTNENIVYADFKDKLTDAAGGMCAILKVSMVQTFFTDQAAKNAQRTQTRIKNRKRKREVDFEGDEETSKMASGAFKGLVYAEWI